MYALALGLGIFKKKQLSDGADGSRDVASRPVDNIALHTELDAECDHQATNVGQYLIALCYTNRQLSAASTYVHGETQTRRGRLVVDIVQTTSLASTVECASN